MKRFRAALFVLPLLSAGFLYAVQPAAAQECKAGETGCEKAQETKEQKAIYHCPMHPQITSNKPDKCPECGMNLVLAPQDPFAAEPPKTPVPDEHDHGEHK